MSKNSVSVLIPTWNGRSLLEKYLAKNIEALKGEVAIFEIIIIDNGSSDGTIEYLKQEFSEQIKVISLSRNFGFGYALNQGIKVAAYPYIYLLNNDLLITKGSLSVLFAYFEKNEQLFSAYPWQRVIHKGKETVYGGTDFCYKRGFFRQKLLFGGDFSEQKTARASWYASGAAALFSKEKLLAIDGFNLLYSPAYFEDTDLSHRAWSRGWPVLSVPTPPVDHWHESTASRIPKWRLQSLQQRNLFIYHWCNIHDASYWLKHLAWLPANLVDQTRRVKVTPIGFLWALTYIPKIIRLRKKQVVVTPDKKLGEIS